MAVAAFSITRLAEQCELAPCVLQCSCLFPGGAVIPLEGDLVGNYCCKYKMFFFLSKASCSLNVRVISLKAITLKHL